MVDILRRALKGYGSALSRYPIRTKIATSFTVLTSADVLRQYLEFRKDLKGSEDSFAWFDKNRMLRMSLWGLTIHPLTIHFWFNHLERWLGKNPVGATKPQILRLALRKVLVDQAMSSPVFLGFFVIFHQVLKGANLEEVEETIRRDWFTMVKAGYSCWPLVHMFGFAFIPVHWRLLYVNIVSLGFGTFLSLMASRGGEGLTTPIDSIYQTATGSTERLGNKETVAKVIGGAWALGAMSMAYNWRTVGWLGAGCTLVGGTAALIELPIVCGHSWVGESASGVKSVSL